MNTDATPPDQDGHPPQHVVRVTNTTGEALRVRIEPWADEREVPSGETHEVHFTGPGPADVEVEVTAEDLVIYGWTGSVLDGQGIPVPPAPPGQSMRAWTSWMRGRVSLPDAE